jgi:hypothetical protein
MTRVRRITDAGELRLKRSTLSLVTVRVLILVRCQLQAIELKIYVNPFSGQEWVIIQVRYEEIRVRIPIRDRRSRWLSRV